tara:strand:+ start:62 stop:700 length:639 start_codon:yes stop_codon:yes gene_type:complete
MADKNFIDNKLQLWDSVSTTDPKYTKKVNQRGGFTAIAAQSQVKKATEVFGPAGIGWGVKNEQFTNIEGTTLVLYTSTLWYVFNSKTGELPIHSSIKYGANGRYDDDFAKKVATDALTKGLSKLGFNADVFMGLFDDNKYVNQVTEQFADESWKKKLNQVVDKLPDSDKKKFSDAISKKTITSKNYKAYITRAEELLVQFEEAMSEAKKNNE